MSSSVFQYIEKTTPKINEYQQLHSEPIPSPYSDSCKFREELSSPAAGTSIQTFRFGQDLQFDVFVQFKEYMCFVKCMEAFRGMKLMHTTKDGKAYTANIKVQ